MKTAMKTFTALGLIGATTLAVAATVVSQSEPFPQSASATELSHQSASQVATAQVQPAVQQTAQANIATSQAVNRNAISVNTTTVKQALTLADDTHVELKGYIVKSLGDEKYQFRDQTGTMTVDIDDELWNGQAIASNTLVTINGEVDIDYKPMKRVEIDVDYVSF